MAEGRRKTYEETAPGGPGCRHLGEGAQQPGGVGGREREEGIVEQIRRRTYCPCFESGSVSLASAGLRSEVSTAYVLNSHDANAPSTAKNACQSPSARRSKSVLAEKAAWEKHAPSTRSRPSTTAPSSVLLSSARSELGEEGSHGSAAKSSARMLRLDREKHPRSHEVRLRSSIEPLRSRLQPKRLVNRSKESHEPTYMSSRYSLLDSSARPNRLIRPRTSDRGPLEGPLRRRERTRGDSPRQELRCRSCTSTGRGSFGRTSGGRRKRPRGCFRRGCSCSKP